ncbi:GNAT family N-acetyltransferase [Mycolicibacterium houstonense]|uniref:GNAT family N-acetyltransferase n=1 Tax=Mycolicibacterium houstonense TaxID=146021 RepID=UPI000AEB8EF2
MSASSLNAVREPVWETPVSGVIAAGTEMPRSGDHAANGPGRERGKSLDALVPVTILFGRGAETGEMSRVDVWRTRAERPEDIRRIHAVNAAAFPTELEADLVDALRQDPTAWIDGLSTVTLDSSGSIVGYALLTRCTVGGQPALALGPCAVAPEAQRSGAGSAAIRAGLEQARRMGENLVVVLGHAEYYPRFGFEPASRLGITAPFEAPDQNFLALALQPDEATPRGEIAYAEAFGV